MNTNIKLLKQVLCLFFICIVFISSSVVSFAVEDEDKFYYNDRDALEELFNMTLSDVYGDIKDPMGWLSNGKTFVVIREYEDEEEGTKYKIYVNAPNLPQYLQNMALKTVSDGWEDKTYVPESSLIESVGKNDDNVLNKFGFHISVNKYQGEYPRMYMTLSGILPVKWYQKIWRGIKALVGLSFVNAPDKENFKTLNYYNHMYSETDEDLIDFIQEYWLEYFVGTGDENAGIWSDADEYFRDAEDFKSQLVTKDDVEEAEQFLADEDGSLHKAQVARDKYDDWCNKYNSYEGAVANIPEFKNALDEIQEKIDNATTDTQKLQYTEDLKNKKTEWETYVDNYAPEVPSFTEEQSALLAQEEQYQMVLDRFHDFEDKWEKGYDKNNESYKSGNYKFSYAQCLLDINEDDEGSDENDCTKMVDGQSITGSVVEIFVQSGVYKVGLTKDCKKELANSSNSSTLRIPVDGKVNPKTGAGITSYFGNRTPPKSGASSNHGGIDIAYGGINGKPVYASAAGVVKLAGNNGGYGNCVIIQHNDRMETLYGHLSKITVHTGDSVSSGQQIGNVGSTGVSTGPHLHYEVHIGGKRVDPVDFLDTTVMGYGAPIELEYKDELTRAEAIKIITLLQNKCGPTYKEVMENIVTCMIHNAANVDEEIELEEYIDPRVMPYDRDTLLLSAGGNIEEDGENVYITDPRVTIYKTESLIGGYVATGQLRAEKLFKHNLGAKIAIEVCSLFGRWSVFLNQITNFTVIDNLGLSPTNMWKSVSSVVIISLLMIFLIINMIQYAFKFIRGKAGLLQVLGRLVFFIGILSLIFLLTIYPDQTWKNYKNIFNSINNLGELTVVNTMDNVEELYGNGNDASVTYYLPYFNVWTLYNTGYSLSDPQQIIDDNDPETDQMHYIPEIAGTQTTLWPVVLADSFNRNGEGAITISGNKNGINVNPNAYRVVDHFLAPRLYTTGPVRDSDDEEASLNMVNTVNENYNGKFQKLDFFTGLGCMVNGFTVFIISLIKAITFLWAWYMLYIFVFNILLGAAEPRNGVKNVVIRTFSPIVAMAVVGAWAGLVVEMSIISTGFINLAINFTLLWLTFKFLTGWQNRFALSFPAPLKYLVLLADSRQRSVYMDRRRLAKANYDARHDGVILDNIIDSEGNYIGSADDEAAKERYKREILSAQADAKSRNNYDDISNEAIRKKIQQLDKVYGVTMPGTASFSMEQELKNHSATRHDIDESTSSTDPTKKSSTNTNTTKRTEPYTAHDMSHKRTTSQDPTTSYDPTAVKDNHKSTYQPSKIGEGGNKNEQPKQKKGPKK